MKTKVGIKIKLNQILKDIIENKRLIYIKRLMTKFWYN
jgi:hypothetical protein